MGGVSTRKDGNLNMRVQRGGGRPRLRSSLVRSGRIDPDRMAVALSGAWVVSTDCSVTDFTLPVARRYVRASWGSLWGGGLGKSGRWRLHCVVG